MISDTAWEKSINFERSTLKYSLEAEVRGTVELIIDCACETGEGPLWHPVEQRLYWCDIPRGKIFRYTPGNASYEEWDTGRSIGGFTFQADGSLLLFMDRGAIATWRDDVLHEVVPSIPLELGSRFNDVIADPCGRVFCGTMSTDKTKGRLYRLNSDGSIHLLLEEVGCSNGMAFTLDHTGFFYTDSFAREIYLFDYCKEDGSISNRRVFARFEETDGMPDGITLDSEGQLWCALWDGGAIIRLGKTGKIETKIAIPTPKTSSLTFGGLDYRDIYITTAGSDIGCSEISGAGGLFRARSEVSGRPEFFSRVEVIR